MPRKFILHMFTPGRQMSPFDINMAVDAGYEVVVPYAGVGPDEIRGMTQDAIFSRGPKGVKATGIFIGGRDAMVAADMLGAAREAMVPPFEVSVMADPSGAYTTAAALVAAVERRLRKDHGLGFAGQKVVVLGGTGPVGRVAAALAAGEGARVVMTSHRDEATAVRAAGETGRHFGCTLEGAHADAAGLFDGAAAVFATAAAGVQVMSAAQVEAADALRVAADVNAVPPEGIAGVGVMDDGKPLPGGRAVGVGALAIGNVKYQVQQRLLVAMREADKPRYLGFREAFAMARTFLAEGD